MRLLLTGVTKMLLQACISSYYKVWQRICYKVWQNFITTLREKCPNAGKYGQEKTPYLDTFHIVQSTITINYYKI